MKTLIIEYWAGHVTEIELGNSTCVRWSWSS